MPSYEFRCDSCGYTFVRVTKIDDRNDPLSEPCPDCGIDENTIYRIYCHAGIIGVDTLKADKRMDQSGVQNALERIRDNHKDANMKWKG